MTHREEKHDDTSSNRPLHELTHTMVDDISEHVAPRIVAIIRERIRIGDDPETAQREEMEKVAAVYERELAMRFGQEPME